MYRSPFLLLAWLATMLFAGAPAHAAEAKRPVSVRDSIELRKFGSNIFDEDGPILLSPDGTKYAFVVRNGDLRANKNEYRLYLFETPSPKERPSRPREVLRLKSGSNTASIQQLSWAKDSKSLVFFGDAGDGIRRVHRLKLPDLSLESISPPGVDVLTFAFSDDSSTFAYVAQGPDHGPGNARSDGEKQAGLLFEGLTIWEMSSSPDRWIQRPQSQVVVVRNGRERKFPLPFDVGYSAPPLQLSPSGKYLILDEHAEIGAGKAPEHWAPLIDKGWAVAANYWVLSTDTAETQRLIDAPRGVARGFAWSSDDTVLIGTKLPVGEGQAAQHYTVEIDLRSGSHRTLTAGWFDQLEWDPARRIVRGSNNRQREGQVQHAAFRKHNGGWESIDMAGSTSVSARARAFVEQGMNLPPRLIWQNADGLKTVLLDPNPQLRGIALGEAQEMNVRLPDGKNFKATLYLPENWAKNGSYPAVLQTYYRDPTRFTLDGNAMTSGMSARALAGRGFVVVQLDLPDTIYPETTSTPDEGRVGAAVYEEVVRELVRNYGVDPARVGLSGFSRSGVVTRYALANSNSYAAAVQTDSMYVGYVSRVLMHDAGRAQLYDDFVGPPPSGEGLKAWLERAAAFSAHRIDAPLLVMNFGQWSDVFSIEERVTMELANKPAEFVTFPMAAHNPVRPAERFAVQSRFVDWFRFWLQDYEDPTPEKADQYLRWRKLRNQRDVNRALMGNR